MIVEAGIAKAIAAGGGLVSGVALIAGMAGGGQVATAQADQEKFTSAVCAYTSNTPTRVRPIKDLTKEQAANAKTIVNTARELGLPERAAVLGVATGLQESNLRTGVVGDHGQAHGVFQQHPQHGWGTLEQVKDTGYAARAFFKRLVKVKNWDTRPLTEGAQAVQRSAFPDAYAKHEDRAKRIVAALTSGTPAKDVKLSTKDAKLVQTSLEAAISLGVPRSMVVADVAAGIQADGLPSIKTGEDPAKQAEEIVQSVAAKLCAKLSAKIGEVLEGVHLPDTGKGAIAVKNAIKWLGTAYSWGGGNGSGPTLGIGRGARTRGFDCSGLAEYAWAKAGVKIGGHTSTQWRSGKRVPRSQLKPGDLIFFATNPKNPATIHHVVINIDGKRYVHAPYTGSVVKVDRWTANREAEYAGAVRPG